MQPRYKRAGRKFVFKKINVQPLIRPCRLEFLVKINNRAARLFGSLEYSQVPIKRVGHNKRVGWKVLKKMLNVQGESVPNKRVG